MAFSKPIVSRSDVEEARRAARAVTHELGFRRAEAESVVLAVSELGMNLLRHAGEGLLTIRELRIGDRAGVAVESTDAGPGITDLERALTDGYSTGGGLGSGLAGVRRLMDDFSIESGATGTRILAHKWRLSE